MKYDMLPEHMQEGARAYIEHGRPPGHFLRAVLENNLVEAITRVDAENWDALREWVVWVYQKCPAEAWGSPEAVRGWIHRRGLKGEEAT